MLSKMRWIALGGRGRVVRTFLVAPFHPRTWAATVHLLLDVPVGFAGVLYAAALFVLVELSLLIVGVPVLAAWVLGGRAWGALERARARALLAEAVPGPPAFQASRQGIRPWLGAALRDGRDGGASPTSSYSVRGR